MNKGAFLKQVAHKNRKPIKTKQFYNEVLTDLLDGIKQELAQGRSVSFLGFGTFTVRQHKGGEFTNPRTMKKEKYKPYKYVAFRPGSALKQKIKGKR